VSKDESMVVAAGLEPATSRM